MVGGAFVSAMYACPHATPSRVFSTKAQSHHPGPFSCTHSSILTPDAARLLGLNDSYEIP